MTSTEAAVRPASRYETIYILRPDTSSEDSEKIAGRVAETVDRLGGKLTRVDNWGKRRLAYPIRKQSRGSFVYFQYVGFNDLVAEIERNLRLLDTVMRFQTILVGKDVDVASLVVDPEEVKYVPIEAGAEEDEPEETIESRLGLTGRSYDRAPREDYEASADATEEDAVAASPATESADDEQAASSSEDES